MKNQKVTTKVLNLDDACDQWNDMLEDFDYSMQQAVVNLHIAPNDLDNYDYYRWLEIMNAKAKEDRPIDFSKMMEASRNKKRKEVNR